MRAIALLDLTRNWIVLALTGIFFLPAATAGQDNNGSAVPRDAIRDAWQKRTQLLASVSFEWTQTLHAKESPPRPSPPQQKRDDLGKAEPKEGTFVDIDQKCVLRLDNDKLDFRLDSLDAERFSKPIGYRTTFDGELSWNYSGTSRPGANGSGTIVHAPYKFSDSVYCRPLLLHCRPANVELRNVDIKGAAISSDVYRVGPHACWLVRKLSPNGMLWRQFYLDRDAPYLIRRYEETVDDIVRIRMDVDFEPNSEVGWLPKHWRILVLDAEGALDEDTDCVLRSYDLHAHHTIDDFRIAYPKGTIIQDESGDKTRRIRLQKEPFVPSALAPVDSSGWQIGPRAALLAINVIVFVAVVAWIMVAKLRKAGGHAH